MKTHRDIIDSAVTAMSEHLCELLGVDCTPEVLAHWQTTEGQAALAPLVAQLRLMGARALTIAATAAPESSRGTAPRFLQGRPAPTKTPAVRELTDEEALAAVKAAAAAPFPDQRRDGGLLRTDR